MDFIFKLIKKATGVGGIEAISAVASGGSISGAAASIAKRGMAKKFENILTKTAMTYASGYNSNIMASLGQGAISAGVAGTVWGALKLIGNLNEKKDDEDQSDVAKFGAAGATFLAFLVFALVFMLINVTRKQRMFSLLAGDNMINQYAKFFTIPLAILFVVFRVMIPSESMDSAQVLLLASSLSGLIVGIARKFFFVYKFNMLEKGVFDTLTGVFEKCQDVTGVCDHEHSGFMKVFNGVDSSLQHNFKLILGDLDYASITREISKSQKFDTLRAITG